MWECDQHSTEGEVAMSDRRTELGFERTVCDCSACKINCEYIPGFLLPSDIRRIALHLGYSNPVEFALDNLLASPGAIVVDRGQIRQIRTLAPARRQDGACLFLDEEHRCRIHSVSPYGCSHFDAHQTNEEADLRSSAGHYQVDLAWKNDHLYARLWLLLKALGRVAPSPVAARARMRAAIKAQDDSS
jgi:Fe-S-cluster containining protein